VSPGLLTVIVCDKCIYTADLLLTRNGGAQGVASILLNPAGFALIAVTNPDEPRKAGQHAG
jgi:hypothetical protein